MHEHMFQGQKLRHDHPGGEQPHGYYEHPEDGARVASLRHHSSDDMDGVGELADVISPVAVVLRKDGSVDVYGDVAVVDQRTGNVAPAELTERL